MAKRKRKPRTGARQVPVEYYIPDDLPTEFTDGCIVRHTDEAFFVAFLQIQQPMALKKEDLAKITKVRSECIAQLVMTPSVMKRITEAFQGNFNTYLETHPGFKSPTESEIETGTLQFGLSSVAEEENE